MAIRAELLDMDGTIWDSPVDWSDVRSAIGLPNDGRPIMEHLDQLPPRERERGLAILEEHEARGARDGQLVPGTHELLELLAHSRVRTALVTNNSRGSADRVLSRYGLKFDLVVSRDEGALKPSPLAFLDPLRKLGHMPQEAVAVGDTHLDVLAAHAAGVAHTILVAPGARARRLLPKAIRYLEVPDLRGARLVLAGLLSQMAESTTQYEHRDDPGRIPR